MAGSEPAMEVRSGVGGARLRAFPELDGADHLADAGLDLGAPAGAVEHAVMADAGLDVVQAQVRRQVAAQVLGGLGLPAAGDVVLLALDRHQRYVAGSTRSRPARPGAS